MWVWIAAGIFVVTFVFVYALCRVAALADLHAMARYASKPKPVADPWELPVVGGGIYDHETRGDFLHHALWDDPKRTPPKGKLDG